MHNLAIQFNDDELSDREACRKLWAAVLDRARKDACDDTPAEVARGLRPFCKQIAVYRDQARAWFMSDDDGPCTFLWVCDVLDIDPALGRKRLKGWPRPAARDMLSGAMWAFMRKHGLSQKEFAQCAGTNPTQMSQIALGYSGNNTCRERIANFIYEVESGQRVLPGF